ncbi:MAG: fumarate reductase/succinate dehydrogenase flavoprotein domain protein [Lacrimispora sp.]|nr:fumarate reductase/succinate dehydrogenase flavoprotein domain protein [Lacrimispora sp.]
MSIRLKREVLTADVLIIGGGTAGCFAALTLSENSELKVIIAEKAGIRRSGCLAAGVNAINAYITEGQTAEDYVDYAMKDAAGIAREDLLLSAARRFNKVTADLERLGLVILKDEKGNYVTRGKRNIKINGENIKPILADAVLQAPNVTVLEHVTITDLLIDNNEVKGAVGFHMEEHIAYEIQAPAVIVSTGGAAGLYKPNNPGFSRHKMWYPPFNTGAGYAMGMKAGAEMTSFEMRFIALRCKDTIAPTGTIAQGVRAKQVNSKGEVYEEKYGITTSERVYGTVRENHLGNGPCYLHTEGIDKGTEEDLLKAYLNMAPSQTLKWLQNDRTPGKEDVEIAGTEPYIVGGHTASGYWINTNRETTVKGLYAAGDVAGGCPQKYVTGALAEGEIAALDIIKKGRGVEITDQTSFVADEKIREYESILNSTEAFFSAEELEEAMQKVMDEYAGGISTNYQFNEKQLMLGEEKIVEITELTKDLNASDMHELMFVYELKERLIVCRSVIAHLGFRKETRWHSFQENLDFPGPDEKYRKFVNSTLKDGTFILKLRDIGKEIRYEHTDF